MNIIKFSCTYQKLLQHLINSCYSDSYIAVIKTDINWLLANYESYGIESYEQAYEIRSKETDSSEMERRFRLNFGILKRFEENDEYPDYTRKIPLVRRGSYYQLNEQFKEVMDLYQASAYSKRIVKECTIQKRISAGSCFLLKMQNDGHADLSTITEDAVLSFFTQNLDSAKLSSGYKKDIAAVFKEDLGIYSKDARRMLAYLPAIRPKRQNIQYLQPEEASSIHEQICPECATLSLRNKAIATLLYFTGMRACDILSLDFSDINWETEEIKLNQQKTDVNLCLPLTATIGNALFDYITSERPQNSDSHIFLSEARPYSPLSSGSMYWITKKIYQAAAVRQNPGDRQGSHLFRYNLATILVSKGISRPVISDTLGHADPNSLDFYLKADIENLRSCALRIDKYPVAEEVFKL